MGWHGRGRTVVSQMDEEKRNWFAITSAFEGDRLKRYALTNAEAQRLIVVVQKGGRIFSYTVAFDKGRKQEVTLFLDQIVAIEGPITGDPGLLV